MTKIEKNELNQCNYIIVQVLKNQGYIELNKLVELMKTRGWKVERGVIELRCREINSKPQYQQFLNNAKIMHVQTHNHDYIMHVEKTATALKLAGGRK